MTGLYRAQHIVQLTVHILYAGLIAADKNLALDANFKAAVNFINKRVVFRDGHVINHLKIGLVFLTLFFSGGFFGDKHTVVHHRAVGADRGTRARFESGLPPQK